MQIFFFYKEFHQSHAQAKLDGSTLMKLLSSELETWFSDLMLYQSKCASDFHTEIGDWHKQVQFRKGKINEIFCYL
jgi:hypothetical protein